MAGFSSVTGDEAIMFADNVSFNGTQRGGKVTTNGQLLIGSTASPHIRVGNLTSSDGSIIISNGAGTINLSASGGLPYKSLSPYIVGQVGDVHASFTSIQTAINQAVADGGNANVYVKPGTYTENITLAAGINIVGFSPAQTTTFIKGKISASYNGTACIYGIALETNGDYCLEVTGATTTIYVDDCYIWAKDNNAVHCTNGFTFIYNCYGQVEIVGVTYFVISGGKTRLNSCGFYDDSASVTATTVSGGSFRLHNCLFQVPIVTSGTGTLEMSNTSTLASVTINDSSGTSGVASSEISNVTIGAGSLFGIANTIVFAPGAPAISGAGTLTLTNVYYNGTSASNTVAAIVNKSNEFGNVLVDGTLNLAGQTTDGVFYYDGTKFATTSAGTAGFVLTSNGAGVAPTYQSLSSVFPFTDKAISFAAASNNGYFCSAAVTATLPAAPSQGDTIVIISDVAGAITIQANTGQFIRVGTAVSASAGTSVSAARGDSMRLVYRTSDTTWISEGAPQGVWVTT